jgi:hypothetical protein
MDLHPTPESWRVALVTAVGSTVVAIAAVVGAEVTTRAGWFWLVMLLAGIATLLPAIGALSASVDVAPSGVRVRRFGVSHTYAWHDIAHVGVVQRRAQVPDGTEYHWWFPSRIRHDVAVPTLELADGTTRQLPALAMRAGDERDAADACAAAIERYRTSYAAGSGAAIA